MHCLPNNSHMLRFLSFCLINKSSCRFSTHTTDLISNSSDLVMIMIGFSANSFLFKYKFPAFTGKRSISSDCHMLPSVPESLQMRQIHMSACAWPFLAHDCSNTLIVIQGIISYSFYSIFVRAFVSFVGVILRTKRRLI
jgi:hypothetical protein